MDINLFRTRCQELREKFGEDKYPREDLNAAWAFWKDQTDKDFLEFVNRIISFNHPLKLNVSILEDDREDPHEAIGFKKQRWASPDLEKPLIAHYGRSLEEIRAKAGVSSLADLVDDKSKREKFLRSTGS